MKTKKTLLQILIAIPLLFSVFGCSNNKKSSSRVGVGAYQINGGVCYVNGVPQSNVMACQGNGNYVLENGVCVQYINGMRQQAPNPAMCTNNGGVYGGGTCTMGGVCSGVYQGFIMNGTPVYDPRMCNPQYNDCRGWAMICNGQQVVCY